MKRAIVLLSGGVDSTVTLYYAKKSKIKVHCLIFDYNQRHRREIQSACKIAKLSKSSFDIIKLPLPAKGNSLIDRRLSLPERSFSKIKESTIPDTYVPARNIIFLSFALSYAETIKADSIFIGANAIDYSGYPDCRPEFLRAFVKMSKVGTKRGTEGKPIRIIAPLINKTKAEIIKLGKKMQVPFEYTWSCYRGRKYPCGVCDSCKLRARGFKEAGYKDPVHFKNKKVR